MSQRKRRGVVLVEIVSAVNKPVTTKDAAAAAGVLTATVSSVLEGDVDIRAGMSAAWSLGELARQPENPDGDADRHGVCQQRHQRTRRRRPGTAPLSEPLGVR